MNRSYIFWLATIIGIVIGIYLYFRYISKTEHFVDGETAKDITTAEVETDTSTGINNSNSSLGQSTDNTNTESSVTSVDCPSGRFLEDISAIPYNTNMKLYLSSFSTRVKDKIKSPYCPNQMRWFDLIDPSVYFNVNTVSPPSSIVGKGMPMKNVTLIGPPSDYLASDTTSFEMNPFTLFFYASMNTPDFTEVKEKGIKIFHIYAETPNSVRLTLKPSEMSNRTRVELVLGAARNLYVWDITTSTLVSNGNPTLYALTVDTNPNAEDKVATLYIGKSKYTANITITNPIKLGNSRMEVNSSGALNALLFSLGYIEHKLTDAEIDIISNYMQKQQTGVDREIAETTYIKENEAKTQIKDLQNKITQIKQQTPSCASTNEVPRTNMNDLFVQDPGENGETTTPKDTTATTVTTMTATTTTTPDVKTEDDIKIFDPVLNSNKQSRQSRVKAPVAAPVYKGNNYNISNPEDISETIETYTNNDDSIQLTPIRTTVLENTTAPVIQKSNPSVGIQPIFLPKASDKSKTYASLMGLTPEGVQPPYNVNKTTT